MQTSNLTSSPKLSITEMTIAVFGAIVVGGLFIVSYHAQTRMGFLLGSAVSGFSGIAIWRMVRSFRRG